VRDRHSTFYLLPLITILGATYSTVAVAQGIGASNPLVEQGRAAAEHERYPEAFALFKRAAEQGDARAQFEAGSMYAVGRGVEKNCDLAMNWLSKSANQNFSYAQGALASVYFNGDSCAPKDYAKAKMWAQKAADQDEPVSQGLLGIIHLYGYGGKPDYKTAMNLFLKSVNHQYSDPNDASQFERTLKPDYLFFIGVMHEGGLGVPKDDEKAIAWYQKASEIGNSSAKGKLEKLRTPPAFRLSTIDLECHNSKGTGHVKIDAVRRAVTIQSISMEYQESPEQYVSLHGNTVEFGCRTLKSASVVTGEYFNGFLKKAGSDQTLVSDTVKSIMCLARNKIDLGTGLWTLSGGTDPGALTAERTECSPIAARH
jgi:TPR repeat protein